MPTPAIGAALPGDGRDDRELELLGVGGEVEEELVDLVEHLVGPGVAAVDLVEHHDRGQLQGQRLRQHVAGLGQRALGRVDQQEHAVDHRQRPLDLAAEVGVAGRVDQVDAHALPLDRGRLGEDGDAPLTLLVVGVHHPVDERLVGAEHAGGAQQGVDQGGLAVVDVGDERDVAEGGDCTMSFSGAAMAAPWGRPVRSGPAVLPVVVVFVVVVEGDAVLLRDGGVLVIFGCGGPSGLCGREAAEGFRAGLLELPRFFEAAMATLLHGRAPGVSGDLTLPLSVAGDPSHPADALASDGRQLSRSRRS